MEKDVIVLGSLYHNPKNYAVGGRAGVYSTRGYSPTIVTMGGWKQAFYYN